jgi:tetratricopeptide (TPR) repeat protein
LILTLGARSVKLARMMRLPWLPFALVLAFAAPAFAATAPAPPAEAQVKTLEQQTDELFDRLAKTTDADEASGIEAAIDRLRLRSGSDTSDLLMSRAVFAIGSGDYPLAMSLLDTIVDLQPGWAEGWNKRATARYYAGDARGSMADIAQTLKRDPRHLGALAGMGMILEESDQPEAAMRAYQRAIEIAPHYQPMLDAIERVKKTLAGRDL